MNRKMITKLIAMGIVAVASVGTTVDAKEPEMDVKVIDRYNGQGQVSDKVFPSIDSSATVVNNSAQTFKAYEGQGTVYFELDGVESMRVYVNGHKLDVSELLKTRSGAFEVDLSDYVINGDNALQIFDVQPTGATVTVDIPYPTLRLAEEEDEKLDENISSLIDEMIEAEVEAKGIPGGQLVVVKDGKIIKSNVYGVVKAYDHGGVVQNTTDVTSKTLYDLASNTKMYAANYAIQKLVYEDKLNVDMLIDEVIPGFSEYDPMKEVLTIRHLLTHTGGFIPDPQYHNPNYLRTVTINEDKVNILDQDGDSINDVFNQDAENMLEMVKKTPLEYTPGSKNVYSDVDYILLGMIVEHVSGQDLETYCEENLFDPLGLERTMFNPLEKGIEKNQTAATEMFGNTREGNVTFDNIRTEVVQGKVHDEKAFYAMEGVSGHAGLFGTAEELAVLMQVMLNGGGYGDVTFFDQHTIDSFIAPSDTNDTYALGWRRQGDDGYAWSFGEYASDTTIGHTGWTGTATNINFDEDLLIVWLTNTKNTPLADAEKNLNRMEGDAFQFDSAGTLSTLVYQSLIGASEEVVYDMLMQMASDRIEFLKEQILRDGNCTEADYKATYVLAKLFVEKAYEAGKNEDAERIIELFPEHTLKQSF